MNGITTKAQWLKKLPPTLYKLGAQAWIDYKYPRHLFLEVTATCNLTCSYCPRERRKADMDFGLFREIVGESTRYGARSFSLHLFGEPLLYPRLRDAAAFIKESNHRHTVLLTTNGTMLNGRHVDWITSDGTVDQVLWSWRPEATFTQETKEKLRKWGKFRVRFIEEVTPPEARAEWADWPNVEGRHLHSYGGNVDLSKWSDTDEIGPTHPCYHLWFAPAVSWDGKILLCCSDPHKLEPIGQFPEMTVHEAWTSDRLKMIRESHLRGQYSGICKNCTIPQQYPDMFFKWQKRS